MLYIISIFFAQTTVEKSTQRMHTSTNAKLVRIMKIGSVIPQISQIVKKCPTSQCWRILQKFLDLNPNADDFQN